ncbi:hypothetical protein OJ997_28840 [Solirubrobacter phytolaccae]|uniref:Uncharacterized protein n=1 Tax=Solirubrobacter phytolaccae TaxID=1404360 RepID=A0A9X3NIA9_9ACTN|nr:hypothetical protein [Solirubrobacter phytolaccae]MDA0184346.1 hypothetical protein [Solirubrobacter phytolaccae]
MPRRSPGTPPTILLFGDNPNIDTAPLPVLVAVACLGFLIVRSRSSLLRFLGQMFAGGTGTLFGKSVAIIAGYGLMLGGIVGTVLWFVDNLS